MYLVKIRVVLLILVFCINQYSTVYVLNSNSDYLRVYKVLSICTDVDDLLYTYKLVEYLKETGFKIELKIVFLNRFSTDAYRHFNMLSNIWFMREFDEIWIFDYSIEYSISPLSYSELNTIERAVSEGRVIVAGLNTYLNHRNELLNSLFGVVYIDTGERNVDRIEFLNKTFLYNSTQTRYLILESTTSKSVGYLKPINHSAVFINKYNKGVAVLLAFNPIEQAVRYGNLDMFKIVRDVITYSTKYLGERENPPLVERIHYTLFYSINVYNILLAVFLFLTTLWITCYIGLLPYDFIKIVVKPLVATGVTGRGSYLDYLNIINNNPGITIYELASRLEKHVGRVKYSLAILEIKGIVESSRDSKTGRLVFRLKSI